MKNFYQNLKFSLVFFLLFTVTLVYGNPIDENHALKIGVNFLNTTTNLSISKDLSTCNLVYQATAKSIQNEDITCFYVFNVSEKGFVIVSADDRAIPILGYSTESSFDVHDIPINMAVYLKEYERSIVYAIENEIEPSDKTVQEWNNLETNRYATKGTRTVEPLLGTLTWHQNCYYNDLCPVDAGGQCGHVYAGCVATAMAQIIKFWGQPSIGTGSHTYHPSGYPQQSVNYGQTTYNYSIMPDKLDSLSTADEIFAVAQLQWHCGVAVDMMYGINGSGAYSSDVPEAMSSHFNYNSQMYQHSRDNYSLTQWQNKLRESFDAGKPVYYSAQDDGGAGGHAFICDGYDANDMFHFNWGWNGKDNGFYAIDALHPTSTNYNFNSWQAAIFEIVPDAVLNAKAQAPSNFTVTPAPNYGLSATLNWTNPTQTIGGTALTSISSIEVLRNGSLLHSFSNPTIGGNLSWTDNTIPELGTYTYVVYAVTEIGNGATASQLVGIGPYCNITAQLSDSYGDGWNGASIDFKTSNGNIVGSATIESGSSATVELSLPQGTINCIWNDGSWDSECSFVILDGNGNQLYTCNNAQNLTGTFYTFDNQCENPPATCTAPTNLNSEILINNFSLGVELSWNAATLALDYNVYLKDNSDYILIFSTGGATEVLINNNTQSIIQFDYATEYCFAVETICEEGNSDYSTTDCITTPSECISPNNLIATPINGTVELSWQAAENAVKYYIYKNNTLHDSIITNSYIDDDVVEGSEYCYKIQSKCQYFNSEFSNEECAIIEICDAPEGIEIHFEGEAENIVIILDWNYEENAISYNIYRDDELIGTSTVNTFDDHTAEVNVPYWYSISSTCSQGESELSEPMYYEIIYNNIKNYETNFNIYPNPANKQVEIEGKNIDKILVYNIVGQLIEETTSTIINTQSFDNGVYVFRIVTKDSNIVSKRIVIQH